MTVIKRRNHPFADSAYGSQPVAHEKVEVTLRPVTKTAEEKASREALKMTMSNRHGTVVKKIRG